jgi:NSS family neurotransmitter:Na+ symporter
LASGITLEGGAVAGRAAETWSGRPAFILASIGAAVGLGNIWKFPYTLGNSGGSAFVLIYVLAMLLIATPIMLSEMVVGRHARLSAPSALRKVALENGSSTWWQAVGWMGQLVQLLVLSFYSVIAGWTMAYLFKSVSGGLGGLAPEEVRRDFDAFLHDPSWMVFWHFLFTALTVFIVSRGVRVGLERVVRVLMPGLFVMLVGLVVYAAANFEFGRAAEFLFTADLS